MKELVEIPPRISVVIPAYNHENFIGAAIESVLCQSFTDFELIIIDDGSTDKTADVIKSFTDSRIAYYHQENQDAFNTINRGISLAKGEYIAILNSDDVYTCDRLEKLYQYCQTSETQCVITDVIPIGDDGTEFTDPQFGWNVWHSDNRTFYFESEDIYTAFLHGNFMVTTSNLFLTTAAARTVGEFCSLRYLHDYDYIFRVMLAYPEKVKYLAGEKLLYYRIHSGNTLGEAAIIGREQDQQLIKQYMVEGVPVEYHHRLEAGANRLIALGAELHEVRSLLNPDKPQGVRPAFSTLQNSLKHWAKKKFIKKSN